MNWRTVAPVDNRFKAFQIEYSDMDSVAEWLNEKFGKHVYYWRKNEQFIERLTSSGRTTTEVYVNGDWIIDKGDHFEVVSVSEFNNEYKEALNA